MPPKRKNPTETEKTTITAASSGTSEVVDNDKVKYVSYVYVLIKKDYYHGDDYDSGSIIVGKHNSKIDAIAAAGDIETNYGTFDEAIAGDMFEDCYEDYRNDAPDNGLLLKIGREDVGEGDNVQLIIEKHIKLNIPTKKRRGGSIIPDVYVLLMKDHSNNDRPDTMVGMYDSKNDAIAAAGKIQTNYYGTFDEAIAGTTFHDCYEDHRKDAPDNGLLLKIIGHEDVGEGNYVQLFIEKTMKLDMPITKAKKKKKKK